MKKENNYMKVPSHYVKDDYLQLMLQYKDYLILYGDGKLMYYNNLRTKCDGKNVYLKDERRKEFPYSQIPEHIERRFLVKNIYVNQIFNFDRPYISVHDGFITKLIFYKDGDQTICNSKLLNGILGRLNIKFITRKELENYLESGFIDGIACDKCKTYMFDIEGFLYDSNLEKEQDWLEQEKERLINIVKNRIDQYDIRTLNELKRSIQLLNSIEPFYPISGRIMVKFNINNEVKMEAFSVRYLEPDKYEITIADIPVNVETLSAIKSNLGEVNYIKEPKINLSLNPDISQEVLEQEKTKVLIKKENELLRRNK